MPSKFTRSFFAYPAEPNDLFSTIEAGVKLVESRSDKVEILTWPEMDIFGNGLADKVREHIRAADILVCDVTRPNLNVYYEIGYAIGLGKPIAPVINRSFANAEQDAVKDGFFDGIGFKTYENSEQLCKCLLELPTHALMELYGKTVNFKQPLFIFDTIRKTNFRNAIVSAVKGSSVFFRSFDPEEVPRFATIPIIGESSSSAGIVIPFLASHVEDSRRHNLRAAFLAGIGHGLGRSTLLIQRDRDPIALDYREHVVSISNEDDIVELVAAFAKESFLAAQSITPAKPKVSKSALQNLSLGSSSAENEFRTLELYFVETAEYLRTIRGETRVVAGRKGSGKTAIFFRVRDNFRQMDDGFVTDLKPESHQLSLFREELLKISGVGIFDHTLAAFWHYVLLSEILLTIQRKFIRRARFDDRALAMTTEISQAFEQHGISESGDFTSRITKLSGRIVLEIAAMKSQGGPLTPEVLTNIVFRNAISRIRELIDKFTTSKTSMVLLFDNIDKGWLAQGVHEFDVRMVRLLVEGLDKIRHDFEAKDREFMSVVFLRNDIYELLVGQTPDRGKAGQIRIDWTDKAKLKQVIYRRLIASTGDETLGFEEIWQRFFVPEVEGMSSFEYFVRHCLMRPRFLINIVENAIANGINRGHGLINEEDCIDAVRQHSLYLVNDFGYEIRDVSGLSFDILYSLVGSTKLLTRDEVLDRFRKFKVEEKDLDHAFKLMLWYGVLGVAIENGVEHFIYDYDYDLQRLDAEIRSAKDEVLYTINAALYIGMK